ncbi:UDP-N-acetylmuramoyl-tripeptide--D-alanyl-D-alanine ligase [Leptolyngbyaceae cyanobacterium JSC-12]|nr:UDP-N-acetylmuramoyl-tripeptide--D-alanyl-D-alanine ligase [Leptolyngbyaceae cyanobacterium JSC-12]
MAARPFNDVTMTCQATLAQLTSLLDATPVNVLDSVLPTLATAINTDTRSLQPGEVFLALRGETFDGHSFVETAFEKGAIAAIVDSPAPIPYPFLQVPDTLKAYQAIAHWWRTQFTNPVIAVTGSVGKTTTKELIAAVLSVPRSSDFTPQVLKTQANFNNEIGVPKTLLELGSNHDYAIVEMGMRARGEIALLSQITQPDIAVITNVGTAHIGRLGSEAAIAQAKCELLAEMPTSSIAVLNHDNPLLLHTAQSIWQGKTITFGLEGGDIQGQLVSPEILRVDGIDLPLPLAGRHNALNYLAALAVAKVLGLDWAPLTAGLSVELPGGRAKRLELPNDVVILDETYNAGLESMLASLHLLAQTSGRRRIAVLGTMKELGEQSPKFHYQVGAFVQQLQLDHLLILAEEPEASAMQDGAGNVPAEKFTNHVAVVERLQELVQPGDRLLFKASRAVALDRVVAQFRQDYESCSSSKPV